MKNSKSFYEGSYLESLFDKISKYGELIKNKSLFTDQVFHLVTDNKDEKKQIIFKNDNEVLVITNNGITYKGNWEYLPEYQGITIEFNNSIITYEHSFLNEIIFALKLANSNKIDLYINEARFEKLNKNLLNQTDVQEYLDSLDPSKKNTDENTIITYEDDANKDDYQKDLDSLDPSKKNTDEKTIITYEDYDYEKELDKKKKDDKEYYKRLDRIAVTTIIIIACVCLVAWLLNNN